ncbi:hypothetical protein [Crocosphaera sp.]|uniref:hypothetical protein n=1 Tax=Crocosphaera sp. TaxID=2729996 RepID=UPI0026029AE7|nr:hypothetical protein [Crocosphaera sp.]MDJ0578898.1 hypothetical protein [Crocosphaera sp.]
MLKYFLLKTSTFLSIPLALILLVGITFPPTPRSSTSLLFAKIDKDKLLKESPSPRLIMIGGSNLSFGINSQRIKDTLELNPINTGIHVAIGLKYMMDDVLEHIKPGDIVVIAPEYQQFYGDGAYGRNELLRIVIDIDRESLNDLNTKQWLKILPYFPRFSLSKLKPSEYFFQQSKKIGVYERRAFNQYGDLDIHWNKPRKKVEPTGKLPNDFNHQLIREMVDFRDKVTKKGGKVYVTFPGYQEDSFQNAQEGIAEIEKKLFEKDFILLGSPERYKIPNEMIYDTPYHLSKEGVDLRTQRLIEDLSQAINKNEP